MLWHEDMYTPPTLVAHAFSILRTLVSIMHHTDLGLLGKVVLTVKVMYSYMLLVEDNMDNSESISLEIFSNILDDITFKQWKEVCIEGKMENDTEEEIIIQKQS